MKKVVWVFVLLVMLVVCVVFVLKVGDVFAYSFGSVNAVCGSSLVDQKVAVELSLTNTGGMNIFYLVTDDEQLIMNIYGNVVGKRVTVLGNTDGIGNLVVHVSSNYGTGYSVAFVGCNAVIDKANSQVVSFMVGAFMVLAFAAASVYKWGM